VRDPLLREQALRTTVQLVLGERCALAASSGLINAAPDEASKRFLATQTLDEARHVEIFTHRIFELVLEHTELEDVLRSHANPHLVKFAETLLEVVDRKDFVAGVVGQNLILEGMAFHVFEMMHAANVQANAKFAHTLSGTIADERRHVGFGENRIGALIREHPERKKDVERLQREMSTTCSPRSGRRSARPVARGDGEALRARHRAARGQSWHGVSSARRAAGAEQVLGDTILKEFKPA
jgi:hypothetical protein